MLLKKQDGSNSGIFAVVIIFLIGEVSGKFKIGLKNICILMI